METQIMPPPRCYEGRHIVGRNRTVGHWGSCCIRKSSVDRVTFKHVANTF